MSVYLKQVSFIIGCLFLAACGGNDPQDSPIEPTLENPFTLQVGQTAVIQEADLTLTFDMVVSDGRCPSAVNCAEDGPVIIQITGSGADGESSTFEMNPSPQLAALRGIPPNVINLQAYEIELMVVDPNPQQPEDIMNMDYTATLIVRNNR